MENLAKNDVIVLQDEVRLIDDRFYVIGRQDKSEEDRGAGRKTPAQLMEGLEPDLYRIVLDHQPCEYDQEEAAGASLVLSGHTHGGQFFPFNDIEPGVFASVNGKNLYSATANPLPNSDPRKNESLYLIKDPNT
jgi:predicted MPP superfamily phosphohydrolase